MVSQTKLKTCKDCGSSTNKFQRHKNYVDGFRSVCTPCMNKQKAAYKAKKAKLLARFKRIKGCAQCGEKFHHAALHFAHLDRSLKSHNTNHGVKYDWSKERIKQELQHCRVLCANCHAVETYEETKVYEV